MAATQDISSDALELLRAQARQEGCSPDELLRRLLTPEPPSSLPPDLYRRLLDYTSDTIVIFDLELRYRYVNPIMGRLTGLSPASMIGKTDAELGMPPLQVAYWRRMWQIVLETGQEQIITFDFETTEGPSYFESRLTPIRGRDGQIQYLLAITRNITERRRAEEKLQRTQSVLQRIFDHSPVLLAYMDTDFNFIQVNDLYAQADHKSPAELIGRNHFELYPNAENEAIFRRVVTTGEPASAQAQPFIYPFSPERGTTYWDWSLVPVHGANGAVEGLVLTLLDVTERIQTEQKLLESEHFVSSIVRTVPNLIYIYDVLENRNVFANDGLTTLLGFTPQELQALGSDIIPTLIHPDDVAVLTATINRIKESPNDDEDYWAIYRVRHKDGSWRWVHDRAVVFKRTEDGQVQQIVGSSTDITESKQAEQQMRIKDSAMASSLTPIALADLEGRLTYVNTAFLKLWKLKNVQQALGRSVLTFWQNPEAAQIVIKAIAEQNNYVGELTALLADGTTAEVAMTASMVRDENGHPICMMGSFNDITAQKQAEAIALENERLRMRFQKEQEQNILIQRIISMLSHDLRTPLTLIASSTQMLDLYFDRISEASRREKLDIIGRQVQLALEMLEDTVLTARGNLNERQFDPKPINLMALCQVSLHEIRIAQNSEHQMVFSNPGQVETVLADEVLVSRILLNLLSNAIKYSPKDTEIHLELDRRDDRIVLRVTDQGMGISPADLPYIFDPFYRASNAAGISGTGLGLSIVKDCVTRHQGRVSVSSTLGQGTTFTVELPLIPDPTG
jgi:PAS domain S-box-containing protein